MEFDKIFINDLLLRCIIGINDDERKNKQDVIINITLFLNLKNACDSDDINQTADYKIIKKNIIEMVENSSFFLVEKLCQEIANICLYNERVQKVKVSVEKPGALRFARSVGIEITREKK